MSLNPPGCTSRATDGQCTTPMSCERQASDVSAPGRTIEVVAIEHIGSTAVPGLAAKAVLDTFRRIP